jgi:hypothetical protein
MNYKWARDFALELINQYSIAGESIPESYNNQSDYLKRIPKLLDDAQMYVATNQARIRSVVPLANLDIRTEGDWTICYLPEDCWQVCSSGLIRVEGDGFQRYHRYHQIGDRSIMVPAGLSGSLQLEYFRYPALLGENPKDTAKLDNTLAAQMTLPYYVAAHLVMHDDAFAYQALYNEFEAKLARLAEIPKTEITVVEDAYGREEWRPYEA